VPGQSHEDVIFANSISMHNCSGAWISSLWMLFKHGRYRSKREGFS